MKLVETIKDRCHECYACVRNCPTKAVRVKSGQAQVIQERCINCANCVKICSQGAKEVQKYNQEVWQLLRSDSKVVAGLAPSFPAFTPESSFADWEKFLLELGFADVYEVAWGARLMIDKYSQFLQRQDLSPVISSACPVVVNYIEKYYPALIPNLAPIVSPMGALVEYIDKIEEQATKIVLIGPCHAKKSEFASNSRVSAVMTYTEIAELGQSLTVAIGGEEPLTQGKKIDEPGKDARRIPLAGGLKEALQPGKDDDDFIRVEGSERLFELFELISNDEIKPRFIDALFCQGCISGVDLWEKSYFKKKKALSTFIYNNSGGDSHSYRSELVSELNFEREFSPDFQQLPQPDEAEIWSILNETKKYSEDDLLNCGACGYNSCREKAIAVYQGLAEVTMCLPYLLAEKRTEIEKVQELNRELDSVINSSYDGMIVVDGEGRVERVNDSYLEMIGLGRDKVVDRAITELEDKRVIYPSVSLLTLKEKRNITLVQQTGNGHRILVTATPLIRDDRVIRVIVNARDLGELDMAINDCQERNKMRIYLEQEEEYVDSESSGHIISKSREMKDILKMATKIAGTDSTILITGESGVGKEVIARFIHEQSPEREDFVKINCAAIPERLLESELFGYETGAFSGARREGKSGLIEKADDGTLFLDEIAEMPLNMQAKLLQVIQEHRVTRIGGVDPIEVNFRLITATNQDLKKMVNQGQFREDLYYRLKVVPIEVQPLRRRREDIRPLVNYFSNHFNEKYEKRVQFTGEAWDLLINYDWPGNVRELINLLERVIVTAEQETIGKEFLLRFMEIEEEPGENEIYVNSILPLKEAVNRVEKKLLLMAREEGESTYDIARMLGVNQSTVVRKLKKYFSG